MSGCSAWHHVQESQVYYEIDMDETQDITFLCYECCRVIGKTLEIHKIGAHASIEIKSVIKRKSYISS